MCTQGWLDKFIKNGFKMSNSEITINILMATRNGEKTLPLMLNSLELQSYPKNLWRLLAIDNGSADRTLEILKEYSDRFRVLILNEPEPGKNKALNKALPHVDSDLVVFADDDIVANEKWLEQYATYAALNTDYQIFSGAIKPQWPVDPPDWILNHVPLSITYAITDPSLHEIKIPISLVFGANFAVRTRNLIKIGSFPENIGPSNGNYAMGSETGILKSLDKNKCQCLFMPKNFVYHLIRESQMTKKWTLERAYKFGRGSRRLFDKKQNVKDILGVPRWVLGKIIKNYFLKYTELSDGKRYKASWEFNYYLGYLFEDKIIKKEI